jgi:hypothetical protein
MSKPQKDDLDALRAVIEALTGFEANDQERILRWAREKLGLSLQPAQPVHTVASSSPPPAHPPATSTPPSPEKSATDIKSFVLAKAPASDIQFVAVVAYYYRFEAPLEARKDAVTADDVLEACRLVGRTRPGKVSQTMVNAHHQGLLDRAEGRGSYSINTVGENLVALTLPSGNANGSGAGSARRAVRKKVAKAGKGDRASKKVSRTSKATAAKKTKKR